MKGGVVKYDQSGYTFKPKLDHDITELNSWRQILYLTKLVGQDDDRYNGVGFGNVTQKVDEDKNYPAGKRRFIGTGTQTGGLSELTEKDYTLVLEYDPKKKPPVISEGPIQPSSEALTHGAVYDSDDSVGWVFHAHSPHIWQGSKKLELPTTHESVEYGTPEMAEQVMKLFRDTNVAEMKIFSMGGHEDGIVSFGMTSDEAGDTMINYLAKAL